MTDDNTDIDKWVDEIKYAVQAYDVLELLDNDNICDKKHEKFMDGYTVNITAEKADHDIYLTPIE